MDDDINRIPKLRDNVRYVRYLKPHSGEMHLPLEIQVSQRPTKLYQSPYLQIIPCGDLGARPQGVKVG